ncbi:MAG: dienelactone hydrolase family protein [Actinomycetota bacterium]
MKLDRYLAEEVAVDHADGDITRREALRRLALLGLGPAAAVNLLAAYARDGTPDQASSPSPVPTGSAEALPTQPVTFPGERGSLMGAWADAPDPKGAVLVIHENRGLTDPIRSVAGRFAAAGYAALAIDLLSEEGGSEALGDPAAATGALGRVASENPERFVSDMKAGLRELERRVPGRQLAAVGFCFGGGMVWRLLASGEPRLAAAVPFYGPAPEDADFSGSRAAVLAIYGELDARVNATREGAIAALDRAGLPHEAKTYAGADHAFFNDTSPRYHAEAASQAWQAVLGWFARHLA